MNAPMQIAGAAVAAGTIVAFAVQEVAVAAGAPRSTEDIIKIITAVGGLVLIVGGILTPIVRMIVDATVKKAIAPVVAAVAVVDAKAAEIGIKVDGTASRMEAALASALKARDTALLTIDQLRADKADQKEIIIAQAGASGGVAPSGGTAEASLVQIDESTKAIKSNTAKTVAVTADTNKTVHALKDTPPQGKP